MVAGAAGHGRQRQNGPTAHYEHAVGHRYTHLVDVHKMAKARNTGFNAWVQGNLFLGIEEIYVAERRDFLEAFKSYVTNDRLPSRKKASTKLPATTG
jgi:hypothetical protein